MMPKKPIVVSKNGEYVATLMGFEETAEYCKLHPVTVANLYSTGKASRSGYTFDRPCDYEDTVNSFMNSILVTAEQGATHVGQLCWFGLYRNHIYSKVRNRSIQNASVLDHVDNKALLPFIDGRGASWKYAVVCPEDFKKRYAHVKI